ncbi:MAG: restriction endonuclease subunit S [Lysobacter sp.]|nr:MAG: restriction endonuclease subunit S [Lysobacter sp.]
MSSKKKAAVTKKEARSTLAPKLRFPGFREAAGWPQMRLIDTADRSVRWSFIGGPFGSNLKSSDYVSDGVRIIQLQNIGDGEFFNEYQIFTTAQKADELLSNNIYPGEIIMSKMGDPVGRACLIPNRHDRYVMCSDGIRLVVDEKKNAKYFIYSLINSPLFRAVVEKTATGSTRKRIGLDELKSLPMWLPKKSEQQKIAECLSSVDELIAAQARKVDALKTHKKWLMQQLFPREGETQPRLRFPEFQNAEKWKLKPSGELFANRKEVGEEGLPIYSVTVNDGMVPRASLERNFYDIEDPAGNRKVHKGDIAYNMMRMWQGAQGVAPEDCMVSPAYVVLKPRGDVCSDFFAYLFNLPHSLRLLAVASRGLTKDRLRLYFDDFAKVTLCVPRKAEQQRISKCLNSLDALIAAESKKLEVLKTHKKGMMQQLFPSPEAAEA